LNVDDVDIDGIVKESAEEMARNSSHVFEVSLRSGQLIRADRERVEQVMINLLSNAIKYSLPNTTISVESRVVDGFVEVSVTDHGYGIPEDDQEKVFDRFYRVTKNKMDTFPGMGLGLYISSHIVQRHGGRISVKSKPGDGSRFSFYLPINAAI
jgi:signal transduction histidine kinase